jgi:hypothetical protein
LANSENHWTRLGIAKVFRRMRPGLAMEWRDVLRDLLADPVISVREDAKAAWLSLKSQI